MKTTYKYIIFAIATLVTLSITAGDIFNATFSSSGKAPSLIVAKTEVQAGYLDTLLAIGIRSNVQFTVTPKADWVTVVGVKKGNLSLRLSENELDTERVAQVEVKAEGSTLTRMIRITQAKSNPASFVKGDFRVKVSSATATDAQSGNEIAKSYDANYSTLYHSSWGGGTLPVTLTYNFTNVPKIDYLVYHPRTDGASNGNFNAIEVAYKLSGAAGYVVHDNYTLNGSSSAYKISFGEGLVNPTSIRIKVISGAGNFASCSEMEFYVKNTNNEAILSLFADPLCTTLKPGVTESQIDALVNPFTRKLARAIFSGTYNKEFRVNEFEAFPTVNESSSWMRTSGYNSFENPTGIYFEAGDEVIVFVENTGNEAVSLKIQNQVPGESGSSTVPLSNGINKVVATHKGQAYLNYYTANWKTAPKVKLHFAMARVTGYFDLDNYRTANGYDRVAAAAAWKRILAGAVSPMFDVVSRLHHTCYPTEGFRRHYLNDGVDFALAYDSVVYRQHEIMGFIKYNKVPKNRMYTRSTTGGMFADGLGAGIPNATNYGYIKVSDLDWWGLGHELGHVNQVRPAMKWVGTSEVTNNIYSAYVQHKIGNGAWVKSLGGKAYYRLEHEVHGGDDIRSGAGGRFNAYLNYGIKDGGKWLMTEGPDYFNQTPFGTPLRRNYDHFVKLGPLWQLLLYFQEGGVRPDFYPQIFEMARKLNTTNMSNGALQLNFMRTAIDSSRLNLAPFFEKAGMLKPYNDYIEDYSPGQIQITAAECQTLKNHAAQYPAPESPVIYYICANNWEIYRDKLPLQPDYASEGLVKAAIFSNNSVLIYHNPTGINAAKNAVAFESYDATGKLLRITMRGFGYTSNMSTKVLYPKGSVRVDAVGWDGTRMTVYNKPNL